MVGGRVIEVRVMKQRETDREVARLWCMDRYDECAVYTNPGAGVSPGDMIWWQGGTIYWTPADGGRVDTPLPKIGFSFDPRKQDATNE